MNWGFGFTAPTACNEMDITPTMENQVENEIESLGPLQGVYTNIYIIIYGGHCPDNGSQMENQIENNIEHGFL